MKIIGADERLAEPRGVKALIVGPTGVGKTSLLRTLDPTRTLFVDIEAGDLSVQDVPVDMFRLDDWGTARDLACRIGGPNPSFPANACYSEDADLAHLPSALVPLTEEKRWVVWPWELRTTKSGKEKWTKPPRQARNPRRNARSNDPSTWGSYADAVAAVAAGNADGIGYMLKDSKIGAIDLDHCVDQESTKLEPWAEQLCGEANGSYQEITVSGGGLRIIGIASGPETHRRFNFDRSGAGIELYRNTARYITISGLQIGQCPGLPPLDAFIDMLFARHSGQAAGGLDFNDADPQASPDYDDLIQHGAPEGQRSELFQAVVWHLAGKGWSAEQITDELAQHPNGIGAKYAGRLHPEVSRSYEK